MAAIAILLISADFLASDFITENELPPLLNNAKEKGTQILPVILKVLRFEREKSLSLFQALNTPHNPISNMTEHEQEVLWNLLSLRIEELLKNNQWIKISNINTVWKATYQEGVTRDIALNTSKNEIKSFATQSLISSFDAVFQAGEGDVVVFKS